MFWLKLLSVIAAGIIIWWLWGYVKRNPGAFSKQNLNKGFFALGILALFLIGFVAILVILVK